MNLVMNSFVEEVKEDEVIYSTQGPDGKTTRTKMPYGLVLWSTGIGMQPLVSEISKKLAAQTRSRALTVDSHMKVLGVTDGNIFAVGDCASVENPKLIPKLMKLFSKSDVNNDGSLDFQEFTALAEKISKDRPQASVHLNKLADVFAKYDADHSGTLDLKELECLMKKIDDETTTLPATAQVANQQGKYLAKYFSALSDGYQLSLSKDNQAPFENHLENAAAYASSQLPGFQYSHLGSLAYIGNSAVAELESPVTMFSTPKVILTGFSAMYLWRSIYWSEQVSLRTRLLLSLDWTKRVIFGRDISKF
ncbi:hypothetical protein DSO57_1013178 [Entomophthora muscae]|uniref:Uncharacterized protein n=1 Tax=Entomophthora muscae TaxID=34485 RepID=A0ACC2URW9_9FUNG|nr:hypothetical protein DSO57_1013178 [Entomophthora muscae]